MSKRRGRGEGSIRHRSDGRWEVRIDLGRGPGGRRRRKSAFARTKADAVSLLRKLGGRAADGQLLSTSTPTVRLFLEDWYDTYRDSWRPSTQRGYRGAIDGYLTPAFGRLRLEQLTPRRIQRWLLDEKAKHGVRRRIGLAHAVLRSALSYAQRMQLVTINAATLVVVPTAHVQTIRPLSVDQAATFHRVAAQHRLGALFSVALACGLRLGEATGLLWDDVDLDSGEVRIRQQLQLVGGRLVLQELKTAKSRRTLVLPTVCLEALRAHRRLPLHRHLEKRMKAGADWQDTGLVFTTVRRGAGRRLGTGLHPRNVLRLLHRLLDKAALPHVRFHDLRHSAASLLIAAGVELVEVSMLLGHSEMRVTADLYSHLQQQTASRAAQHMDAVLVR